MVGAVRFELTTSCTRNKRASQATLRPDIKCTTLPTTTGQRNPENQQSHVPTECCDMKLGRKSPSPGRRPPSPPPGARERSRGRASYSELAGNVIPARQP